MATTLLTADAPDVRYALQRVLPAVSRDKTRPALTAAHFSASDGAVHLAATDSYRLHVVRFAADAHLPDDGVAVAGLKATMVGPRERGPVAISEYGGKVSIGAKNGATVVDGRWPNWRQLFPDAFAARVTFQPPGDEVFDYLKAAKLIAWRNGPVRLTVNEGRLFFHVRGEHGDGTYSVPCEAEGDIEEFGVNPSFLADAFRLAGDEVTIEYIAPNRPLIVRPASGSVARALVMPIRLSS